MRVTARRPVVRRVFIGTTALAGAIALASVLAAPSALAGGTPPPRRPVSGTIGVRLDTIPKDQPNNAFYRAYLVRYVRIGTSIRAVITVSNTTKSTHRISLYTGAAAVRHGSFSFGPGAEANQLTTWTRLSIRQLVLKPDTQAPVTVTVRVPKNAYRGQRYAVIWAQVTSKGQITQVSRAGIRMYVSVGSGGAAPPGFAIESITAQRDASGAPMVVARLRNTGGEALAATGTLRLAHGPDGTNAGPFRVGGTVGVGATTQVDVIVNRRVPLGPWTSVLTLKAGFLHRTDRATLTFPAVPVARSADWLLTGGIALAVVLLAAAGYLVARNRRTERLVGGQRLGAEPE